MRHEHPRKTHDRTEESPSRWSCRRDGGNSISSGAGIGRQGLVGLVSMRLTREQLDGIGLAFQVRLERLLGERRIDVVLRRRGDDLRAIDQEILTKGVELCRIA